MKRWVRWQGFVFGAMLLAGCAGAARRGPAATAPPAQRRGGAAAAAVTEGGQVADTRAGAGNAPILGPTEAPGGGNEAGALTGFGLGADPMPRDPGPYRVVLDREGRFTVIELPPVLALPGEPIALPSPDAAGAPAAPNPAPPPVHIPLAAPR